MSRTTRNVLIIISGLLLLLVVAGWVFYALFFDSVIQHVAVQKLTESVHNGSHGKYQLTVGQFRYKNGTAIARGFELARVGYAPNERGTTIGIVRADSVRVQGINWLDVVLGRPIAATSLKVWQPTVYLANAETERRHNRTVLDTVRGSGNTPSIILDSAMLLNVRLVTVGETPGTGSFGKFIRILGFRYDPKQSGMKAFHTRRVQFDIPRVNYPTGNYWLRLQNALGDSQDSTITIDSFSYGPISFRNPRAGSTSFGASHIRTIGLDIPRIIEGRGIVLNTLQTRSWVFNELGEAHSHTSNTPFRLTPQSQLIAHFPFAIVATKVVLPNGSIRLQQRSATGGTATMLDTHDINIEAFGVRLDPHERSRQPPFFSSDIRVTTPGIDLSRTINSSLILDHLYLDTRSKTISVRASRFHPSQSTIETSSIHCDNVDFQSFCDGKSVSIGSLAIDKCFVDWVRPPSAKTLMARPAADSLFGFHRALQRIVAFPVRVAHFAVADGSVNIRRPRSELDTTASLWHFDDGIKLDAGGLQLNSIQRPNAPLSTQYFNCTLPRVVYDKSNSFYLFTLRNVRIRMQDSILDLDSMNLVPRYGEDQFAALHTFSRARNSFQSASTHTTGLNYASLINGLQTTIASVTTDHWTFDYYKDRRKASGPDTGKTKLPNDFVVRTAFPLTIQQINLRNGSLSLRERAANSKEQGILKFENADVTTTALSLDPTNASSKQATRFEMNAIFIEEAPVHVIANYALHDTGLTATVDATVGHFEGQRLNSFLVPNERKEIERGHLDSGLIAIRILHDSSTTTVTPVYHDLKLKVLPPDPNDPPDIEEGIKTFWANAFVVHHNNPRERDEGPVSATTKLTRTPNQALFQFLWLAIKQPLGQIIGGFK